MGHESREFRAGEAQTLSNPVRLWVWRRDIDRMSSQGFGLMRIFRLLRLSLPLLGVSVLSSCGLKPVSQWLLPTPVMYLEGDVRPFDHLSAEQRSTRSEIFFATNRKRTGDFYSGALQDQMRYGVAEMALGEDGETWEDLVDASTTHPRPAPLPVRVLASEEVALEGEPEVKGWAGRVDRAIRQTSTKDLVVYVHGAKVGFEHSCAFAAELKHFSGADVTAVAFDWPTHRELVSYVDGIDLDHAQKSSVKLAELLQVLAGDTTARRIHVVSWSAGARVLSRALDELGRSGIRSSDLRLGAVVFAAGDVPEKDFKQRLPAIHRLSERVIVYVSDDDFALRWSSRLMGGGRRLGMEWQDFGPERMNFLKAHPRLEIVDTSYGKDRRGFDIGGHRYWFQHPWVNSDLILALRTDQPARRRGLSSGEIEGLFYFAPDYGERIGKVAKGLTGGTW